MKRARNWGTVAVVAIALACSLGSETEVARVTSPSGDVDAVLFEGDGGATTSFWYIVYLVPRGATPDRSKRVASLYGAVRSEQAYGVNLNWRTPHHLTVEYLSATSAELLQGPSVYVSEHDINVQLVSGISDPGAPPGGMLYNLQGRPHDR